MKKELEKACQEINKLKVKNEEKDKKINVIQEELKKLKATKRNLETELGTVKAELQISFEDVKNTNEEKTRLKEEKSSMKKIIDGHPKLVEIATRKAREEALKEKEDVEEIEIVEVLNKQKNSGYKRESPVSESQLNNKEERHNCKICKFEAKTEVLLKQHTDAHPDKCDDCGVTFGTAGHLRRHIRIQHKKEVPVIKCEKCNYACNSQSQFKKHNRIEHYSHKKELEIPKNCKFWLRNSCLFGIHCENDHPVIEDKPKVWCRYQENCMVWPNCAYYHSEEERREQCRFQARCSRPNCRYQHSTVQNEYSSTVQCRYGESCNRGINCRYLHNSPSSAPFLVHRPMQSTRLKPLWSQVVKQGRQQSRQEEIIQMWRPWDL